MLWFSVLTRCICSRRNKIRHTPSNLGRKGNWEIGLSIMSLFFGPQLWSPYFNVWIISCWSLIVSTCGKEERGVLNLFLSPAQPYTHIFPRVGTFWSSMGGGWITKSRREIPKISPFSILLRYVSCSYKSNSRIPKHLRSSSFGYMVCNGTYYYHKDFAFYVPWSCTALSYCTPSVLHLYLIVLHFTPCCIPAPSEWHKYKGHLRWDWNFGPHYNNMCRHSHCLSFYWAFAEVQYSQAGISPLASFQGSYLLWTGG